jgi:hypothetical protein
MPVMTTPSVTIQMGTTILPATVVISSVAAGRKIEYQADSSRPDLLIPVTPDVTTPYQLLAVCNSRVSAVKITGSVGDSYEFLPFVYQ